MYIIRFSSHKENTVSKESSTQSTVTHTSKSESEKLIHNETTNDGTLDGQVRSTYLYFACVNSNNLQWASVVV